MNVVCRWVILGPLIVVDVAMGLVGAAVIYVLTSPPLRGE